MSTADRLDAEALSAALGFRRVIVLRETTSTNDAVFEMAHANKEGLVIFAERQTAGRGQYGRRWESAAGLGLWFSLLLRPGIDAAAASELTTRAAGSIAATLQREFGLAFGVKLPNDVYVGARKVAGVLLERRAVAGASHVAILGVGLNVNQQPEDFPEELREAAGSIAMALERPISRQALAIALVHGLAVDLKNHAG